MGTCLSTISALVALSGFGLGLATVFLVDPKTNMGLMIEGMRKAFPREPYPNVTAVGVNCLGFHFEIMAIIVTPTRYSPSRRAA